MTWTTNGKKRVDKSRGLRLEPGWICQHLGDRSPKEGGEKNQEVPEITQTSFTFKKRRASIVSNVMERMRR